MGALIDFLSATELFRGIAKEDLKGISEAIVERKVGAGVNILGEREASCSLYLLREGQVKISIGYPLNLKSDVPIRTLYPGEIFGEFSFIDRQPRSASAQTVTDARILIFLREDYDHLAETRPRVALTLLQNIATILTERIRDITTLWRDSI